jgi:hypothetical protein
MGGSLPCFKVLLVAAAVASVGCRTSITHNEWPLAECPLGVESSGPGRCRLMAGRAILRSKETGR